MVTYDNGVLAFFTKHKNTSPLRSDGHDKPFCTKAIGLTIIDNFKNALGDTDNR